MIERSKSEVQILNERVKAGANILFNLATALLAAVGARFFVQGEIDFVLILWAFTAGCIIWAGMRLLYLLDRED